MNECSLPEIWKWWKWLFCDHIFVTENISLFSAGNDRQAVLAILGYIQGGVVCSAITTFAIFAPNCSFSRNRMSEYSSWRHFIPSACGELKSQHLASGTISHGLLLYFFVFISFFEVDIPVLRQPSSRMSDTCWLDPVLCLASRSPLLAMVLLLSF